MEVISHLLDPLCHKTCWREDQDAIRLAPIPQLAQDQACGYGLAKSHFIGQEEPC